MSGDGVERTWDGEECPRDGCEGELQQQDRINVMCLRCEDTFSHWKDGEWHRLLDQNDDTVAKLARMVPDGGEPVDGIERDRLSGVPYGPHRVPRITCGACGTEHHPDVARRLSGENRPQCSECKAFLREPTPKEDQKMGWFIDWNSRHLERDRDGKELVTDGGRPQDGMYCDGCDESHSNWSLRDSHPAGPESPAMVDIIDCDQCGNTVEGVRL